MPSPTAMPRRPAAPAKLSRADSQAQTRARLLATATTCLLRDGYAETSMEAIGGRRYVDGGVASPASVDLLAARGLDEVIVLAPMASTDPGPRAGLGRIEGVVRRAMTRTLDAEVAQVRAAGTRVLRLEPDRRDLAALGPNFMVRDRRHAALEACLIHARASVARACARDRVGPATATSVRSAS